MLKRDTTTQIDTTTNYGPLLLLRAINTRAVQPKHDILV